MAINVEHQSSGTSRRQALRGRVEDVIAFGIGVKELVGRKPKEALGAFAVAVAVASSAAGYHPEKIVTTPAGMVAKGANEFGLTSAANSVANFVTSEPTIEGPSQKQVQQNVAETVVGNMPQDATQAEQEHKLQEHGVVLGTTPQVYSEETPLSESPVAPTQVQTDPSLTGGAAPGEISGGSPAQIR